MGAVGSDAALEICRRGAHEIVHVTIQDGPRTSRLSAEGRYAESTWSGTGFRGGRKWSADRDGGFGRRSGTAADSGIQKDDIIVEVQQTPVSDPDQALRLLPGAVSAEPPFRGCSGGA